jgi:hypothetical protein
MHGIAAVPVGRWYREDQDLAAKRFKIEHRLAVSEWQVERLGSAGLSPNKASSATDKMAARPLSRVGPRNPANGRPRLTSTPSMAISLLFKWRKTVGWFIVTFNSTT